jgi:hypothetical protein
MNYAANPAFPPIEMLPPLMKNAIMEVYANVQAPLPLIFSSAMGAISLACQSLVDVRRPNGLESPCSLFLLVIAESGERKSSADKHFKKALLEFEQEQISKSEMAQADYEGARLAWEAEKSAILSSIKKDSKKGSPCDLLKERLIFHTKAMPAKPNSLKLIYKDTTPEALRYGLHVNGSSAGIISDEANAVFGGRAMSDLAMLNDMWGGEPLHVARRSTGSFQVHSPRLTLSLMIQPRPLLKQLNRQDGQSRGIGFLARCLIAYPASTQGNRLIENRLSSWQHIPIFQQRLKEILNQYPNNQKRKVILEFSAGAQARWVDEQNNVERAMGRWGYLTDIKDFASKFSENVARMAALFHYFEGDAGDISLETTTRAIAVCSWYMDEFRRLFGEIGAMSMDSADAQQLESWLQTGVAGRGANKISKTQLLQHAPYSLRKSARLEPALARLVREGKIAVGPSGKTMYVFLAPVHFGVPAHSGAERWR